MAKANNQSNTNRKLLGTHRKGRTREHETHPRRVSSKAKVDNASKAPMIRQTSATNAARQPTTV